MEKSATSPLCGRGVKSQRNPEQKVMKRHPQKGFLSVGAGAEHCALCSSDVQLPAPGRE